MDRPRAELSPPSPRATPLRVIRGGSEEASASPCPGDTEAQVPTRSMCAPAGTYANSSRAGRYSQRAPAYGVTVVYGLGTLPPPAATIRESLAPRPGPAPGDEADLHFQVAELLLARGRASHAVLEAQKGMRLREPRPEQRALYAWLLYQRAGAGRRVSPNVWSHLAQALAIDPRCESALRYRALLIATCGSQP